jgi:hypothetical protein
MVASLPLSRNLSLRLVCFSREETFNSRSIMISSHDDEPGMKVFCFVLFFWYVL